MKKKTLFESIINSYNIRHKRQQFQIKEEIVRFKHEPNIIRVSVFSNDLLMLKQEKHFSDDIDLDLKSERVYSILITDIGICGLSKIYSTIKTLRSV